MEYHQGDELAGIVFHSDDPVADTVFRRMPCMSREDIDKQRRGRTIDQRPGGFMKKLLSLLLAVCVLTGCTKPVPTPTPEPTAEPEQTETIVEDNKEFDAWLTKQFVETMENDYLTCHYGVENRDTYGIKKPELIIGDMSLESYEESIDENNKMLEELHAFDRGTLSKKQQYYYDELEFIAETSNALNSYPQFDWVFLPASGIIDNLSTNFSEFVFRSKEDVDDYMVLLHDIPRFIDECITLTDWQISQGVFMSPTAVDDSVSGIDEFIGRIDDNALILDFDKRIEEAVDKGLVTKEEADAYKTQNATIIKEEVIPEYQKVKDYLLANRNAAPIENVTLYNYEGGQDYYKALLKLKSSSAKDFKTIKNELSEYLGKVIATAYTSAQNEDIYNEYMNFKIEKQAPEKILQWHDENQYQFVPYIEEVQYTATFLDPALANDSVSAYYLLPPVDNPIDNVIKINAKYNEEEPTDMYVTLAHEGFPGHMYQFAYLAQSNPNPIYNVISFIGYQEGWAMHAELYSYKWAGLQNEDTYNLLNYDIAMGYIIPAVLDIGINALGWTKEDARVALKEFYGTERTLEWIEGIYNYVADRPGLYIPYGYGMTRMETFRQTAKAQLGSDFDEIEFNTAILGYGPRQYELVETDINDYINSFK